jgi:protein gp37
MIEQNRLDKGLYWQRVFKVNEGCTKCSPACDNCWSETETVMRCKHPNEKIHERAQDVTNYLGDKPTGFGGNILLRHDNIDLPLRVKKPTVFAVWNDLFHRDVTDRFICDAYEVMIKSPQHIFLVLTKRARRMGDFLSPATCFTSPSRDNIYHGVTVCNQAEADEKIPHLLQVPGKRFLSIEPMLGAIDFESALQKSNQWCEWCGGFVDSSHDCYDPNMGIHQVLLGGESGAGARPMHPDWVRGVRDQCQAAGVPFYFKQWGEWAPPEVTFGVHIHNPYRRDWKDTATWFADQWMIGKEDINDDGSGDDDENMMWRIGKKKAGRTLDGQLHDDLIWKGA